MPSKVKEAKTVEIPPRLPVRELADRLEISPVDLLKALIANGVLATITQDIDYETAAIVAEDLGFNLLLEGTLAREAEEAAAVEAEPVETEAAAPAPPEIPWYIADEADSDLEPRAPIVSVMGHVDHGKTTLLDTLRNTTVAAGESGGITQHIGAYALERDGSTITFVDTPGHEAFTAMRARGAQTTDIAVIVVAADDGVMPQTREAVDHARAAGVPIIVAVNKIDLEDAKADRVLQQMADLDIVPDSWGGDTFFIPVSALTGEGLDELLDAILLVAEEAKPRANPRRAARGTILEGRVEQGRGVIASAVVQTGALHTGDTIVSGTQFSRVRAMFDQSGDAVREAGPSMPVEIMGLSDLPKAGARFEAVASDKAAKRLVAERETAARSAPAGPVSRPPITLDDLFARAEAGEAKTLNVVVKTDVQGTVEPVVASLEGLSGAVAVSVLRAAAGSGAHVDGHDSP
ncbi:MAG: translation initiation factor IF-2, partial [Anaerolineae bacterium]